MSEVLQIKVVADKYKKAIETISPEVLMKEFPDGKDTYRKVERRGEIHILPSVRLQNLIYEQGE